MENWSKRQKILFLLAAAWILWSALRTLTDIEILGYSFWQWDSGSPDISLKWFGPIFAGWVLVICYDWVMKENTAASLPPIIDPVAEQAKTEQINNLIQEFEQELLKWPMKQADVAREIIKTTSKGNYSNFDRLGTELTPKQYMKVLDVVKKKEAILK